MARSLSVSVAVLVAAVAAVALSSVAEARPAGRRSTRWGYTGHEISAEIAQRNLSAAAVQAVTRLVGAGGLPSVATWADEIRSDPAYGWSSNLHFVNPIHDPPASCSWNYARDCANNFCVVAAVFNYTDQLLGNKPTPSEEEALKFLTHFALDMHQPLHVCGRDTGGNGFSVRFYGTSTNLHSVWDTRILERTISLLGSEDDYIDEIISRMNGEWRAEIPSWTVCRAANGTICPDEWAGDIEPINCSNVWVDIEEGDDLRDDYYNAHYVITEKLLAQGGLRLAAVLNEIFA